MPIEDGKMEGLDLAAPTPNKRTLQGIQQRLAGVAGKPWKYNPKSEMFIGTTNSLDTYYGSLDLGRDGKEYYAYKDETGSGYRLSEDSKKRIARIKAMGEFLENCREDIEFLLSAVQAEATCGE